MANKNQSITSILMILLNFTHAYHIYNSDHGGSSPYLLPSGEPYRDMGTMSMAVTAGQFAKLQAQKQYHNNHPDNYYDRVSDYNDSYKVPKFYTSNRIVPAVTKQDEDIFDFTDSRLIKPPAENVQNYPLVVEKANTANTGPDFKHQVLGNNFGNFAHHQEKPIVKSIPRRKPYQEHSYYKQPVYPNRHPYPFTKQFKRNTSSNSKGFEMNGENLEKSTSFWRERSDISEIEENKNKNKKLDFPLFNSDFFQQNFDENFGEESIQHDSKFETENFQHNFPTFDPFLQ